MDIGRFAISPPAIASSLRLAYDVTVNDDQPYAVLHVIDLCTAMQIATAQVSSPLLVVDDVRQRLYLLREVRGGYAVDVLDPRTARRLRSLALPPPGHDQYSVHAIALDQTSGHLAVAAACSVAGTARACPGKLAIYDLASAALLHSTSVGDLSFMGRWSLVFDATTERIFVAGVEPSIRSGTISVIDARSGRLVRETPVQGFELALAVDPLTHSLYVDPALAPAAAIDATTGLPLGTLPLTGSATLVVDAASGRALLGSSAGVAVIDTATNTLVHVTPFPYNGHLTLWGTYPRASATLGALDQFPTTGAVSAGDLVLPLIVALDSTSGRILARASVGEPRPFSIAASVVGLAIDNASGRAIAIVSDASTNSQGTLNNAVVLDLTHVIRP